MSAELARCSPAGYCDFQWHSPTIKGMCAAEITAIYEDIIEMPVK